MGTIQCQLNTAPTYLNNEPAYDIANLISTLDSFVYNDCQIITKGLQKALNGQIDQIQFSINQIITKNVME